MSLPALMAGCDASDEVRARVAELIARKARTREMGSAPPPPALLAFLGEAFEAAAGWAEAPGAPAGEEARADAVEVYRRMWSGSGEGGARSVSGRAAGLGRVRRRRFALRP